MMNTPQDWHRRYAQQAGWTQDIRRYLFAQVNIERARRVLEVGCGTGVILSNVEDAVPLGLHGMDRRPQNLRLAHEHVPLAQLAAGDALTLPYASVCFDVTLCHFLLLWLPDPVIALQEMVRVTRPGGFVIALAEPDYGGRLDYPDEFARVSQLQTKALQQQGANPFLGRSLGHLLGSAGLINIQVGLIGGFWNRPPLPETLDLEWQVLASDLADQYSPQELADLREREQIAWQKNERILYVPTFYGWGQVPG